MIYHLIFGIVIYSLGFWRGVQKEKKMQKHVNVVLKNGSVKEVEEVNKIINETFDKRVEEIKKANG
jgi:flagellar basal body P-ring protein FlgI